MTLAVYVIGSAVALVVLGARLRGAHEELGRLRGERRVRDERDEAFVQAVRVSLACLLAGLAAAAWYAPPRPAARPAGSGQAGARQGAADGRDAG